MKTTLSNEKGGILIIFALLLFVIIGFTALAVDVGRWYTVRSELSKSVDAGALAGANNISNPYLDPVELSKEFARANFSVGYLMTDTDTNRGAVSFDASKNANDHTITVTGTVSSPGNLASLFGIEWIATAASGVAKKNKVEIMLVLDRSGSMSGTKIADLKTAATKFVSFFEETQSEDKMGLASFATTARVDVNLGTNYVTTMNTKINAMSASGGTNTEDSLAKGGAQLPDYSGVPGDQRIQQYLIFFSDGMPTALRDSFKFNNTVYDGVVVGQGSSGHANCRTSDYAYMSIANYLYQPDGNGSTYYTSGSNTVDPATTGDGKSTATTSCKNCNYWGCTSYPNTKWYLFESSLGPVSGYSSESCSIPTNKLIPYFCQAAKTLAQQNAQSLKNRYVKIYVIGLGTGTEIDQNFLTSLSSGSDYAYFTPTSSELEAIFQKIAKEIKLRLIQ